MKNGASKAKKQEPLTNSNEFLRRPAKLQPTGKDKYKLNKSARWQDQEDEDEDFDLFNYDDESDDDDDDDR